MKRPAILIFSISSIIAGVRAAYLWYRASEIKISTAWKTEIRGDHEKNIMAWVTGTMNAFNQSGKLNKQAALWTAASVLAEAIATAISMS
jgi:hypothetical protein